jgi:hypothetical protein
MNPFHRPTLKIGMHYTFASVFNELASLLYVCARLLSLCASFLALFGAPLLYTF